MYLFLVCVSTCGLGQISNCQNTEVEVKFFFLIICAENLIIYALNLICIKYFASSTKHFWSAPEPLCRFFMNWMTSAVSSKFWQWNSLLSCRIHSRDLKDNPTLCWTAKTQSIFTYLYPRLKTVWNPNEAWSVHTRKRLTAWTWQIMLNREHILLIWEHELLNLCCNLIGAISVWAGTIVVSCITF